MCDLHKQYLLILPDFFQFYLIHVHDASIELVIDASDHCFLFLLDLG